MSADKEFDYETVSGSDVIRHICMHSQENAHAVAIDEFKKLLDAGNTQAVAEVMAMPFNRNRVPWGY